MVHLFLGQNVTESWKQINGFFILTRYRPIWGNILQRKRKPFLWWEDVIFNQQSASRTTTDERIIFTFLHFPICRSSNIFDSKKGPSWLYDCQHDLFAVWLMIDYLFPNRSTLSIVGPLSLRDSLSLVYWFFILTTLQAMTFIWWGGGVFFGWKYTFSKLFWTCLGSIWAFFLPSKSLLLGICWAPKVDKWAWKFIFWVKN